MRNDDDFKEEVRKHFNNEMTELLTDIRLRAEFEFEDVWLQLQRNPILSNMIDPRMSKMLKKVMKHGYLSGAESGVMLLLEKVVDSISE